VPWIALGGLFTGLYASALFTLNALRRNKLLPLWSMLAALANVGLNLWLIPRYGALGAAWATGISYAILCALFHVAARSVLRLRYPVAPFVAAGGAAALAVGFAIWAEHFGIGGRLLIKGGALVATLAGLIASVWPMLEAVRRGDSTPRTSE
ncbi:MAG: hypothetical protein ACYS22_03785, partial [Planctomycetota bacterium]